MSEGAEDMKLANGVALGCLIDSPIRIFPETDCKESAELALCRGPSESRVGHIAEEVKSNLL